MFRNYVEAANPAQISSKIPSMGGVSPPTIVVRP
jgi:hypothetical protein